MGVAVSKLQASAYAEDELIITKRPGADIGAKMGNYISGGNNYFYIQPRFTARYLLLLSNNLAVKVYYQA